MTWKPGKLLENLKERKQDSSFQDKGTVIKEYLYLPLEKSFRYRDINEHWNTIENITEIRMRKIMAYDYIPSNIVIRPKVINVIAKNHFIFWQDEDNYGIRIWIEEKV